MPTTRDRALKITPAPVTTNPMHRPEPEPVEDDQEHLFEDEESEADQDRSHSWVVAATIEVPDYVAKHSFLRGSFKTAADQRIEALEVYCLHCRRPWDDVADAECEAKVDNTHLIGGDPGVRAKRKVFEPEGDVVWEHAPKIQRRGIGAVVLGDA